MAESSRIGCMCITVSHLFIASPLVCRRTNDPWMPTCCLWFSSSSAAGQCFKVFNHENHISKFSCRTSSIFHYMYMMCSEVTIFSACIKVLPHRFDSTGSTIASSIIASALFVHQLCCWAFPTWAGNSTISAS